MAKDWLGALASLVAILAGIAGAIVYLVRARRGSIEATRRDLGRSWTNEGAMDSEVDCFIDLDLRRMEGDLMGR
jgi:hypothetical protein